MYINISGYVYIFSFLAVYANRFFGLVKNPLSSTVLVWRMHKNSPLEKKKLSQSCRSFDAKCVCDNNVTDLQFFSSKNARSFFWYYIFLGEKKCSRANCHKNRKNNTVRKKYEWKLGVCEMSSPEKYIKCPKKKVYIFVQWFFSPKKGGDEAFNVIHKYTNGLFGHPVGGCSIKKFFGTCRCFWLQTTLQSMFHVIIHSRFFLTKNVYATDIYSKKLLLVIDTLAARFLS